LPVQSVEMPLINLSLLRKFGRRVMYAVADLEAWADARSFEMTSDPQYTEQHVARRPGAR